MVLAIDGTVYKYNLGTKELIMQFKSVNILILRVIVSDKGNEII